MEFVQSKYSPDQITFKSQFAQQTAGKQATRHSFSYPTDLSYTGDLQLSTHEQSYPINPIKNQNSYNASVESYIKPHQITTNDRDFQQKVVNKLSFVPSQPNIMPINQFTPFKIQTDQKHPQHFSNARMQNFSQSEEKFERGIPLAIYRTEQQLGSQFGSLIEERIIQTYKKEIARSKELDADFLQLKLRFEQLNTRKSELEGQIQKKRKDNETEFHKECQKIEGLKQDLQAAKTKAIQANEKSKELNLQIQETQKIIQNHTSTITQNQQDQLKTIQNGQRLTQEISQIQTKISENNSLQQTQAQSRQKAIETLASTQQQNKILQSQVKEIKVEIASLKHSQQREENLFKDKNECFKKMSRIAEATLKSKQKIETDTQNSQQQIEQIKLQNDRLIDSQQEYLNKSESEKSLKQEHQQRLKQLGKTLNQLQDEKKQVEREMALTKESQQKLVQHSKLKDREVSKLQQYIELLELQNQDLKEELEEFINTEEVLRSELDRRSMVQGKMLYRDESD